MRRGRKCGLQEGHMRDIRFRAWDKEEKKMYYGVVVCDQSWSPNIIADNWRNGYIMQYIGLKDRKGIDIYDSDFVEFDQKIWEVIYRVDRFLLRYIYKDKVSLAWSSEIEDKLWKNCLVIGNIYENPELLKYEK